jgi:hypothetical protein
MPSEQQRTPSVHAVTLDIVYNADLTDIGAVERVVGTVTIDVVMTGALDDQLRALDDADEVVWAAFLRAAVSQIPSEVAEAYMLWQRPGQTSLSTRRRTQ